MWRVTNKIFKIFSRKQKGRIFVLTVMMLIGGIAESISVSLILPLCMAVVDNNTWQDEWYAKIICNIFHVENQKVYVEVLLILLIVVFIIKNLYLLFEYYCQYSFIAKSRYNMQRNLIRSYISKPYDFYLTASSGEIFRIVTNDTVQTFNLLSSLLQFYTEIIVSIILGITIVIVSPYIAIRMIVILLVELLVISRIIKPVLKKMGTKQRAESTISNNWLLQSVNGIKSVKVARSEKFFEENYSKHAETVVNIERINQTLSNAPRLIIEAFTMSGALAVILFMVANGTELVNIFPQLSAFVVATVRLLPSVNRISSSINSISFSEGGLDNVINVLESEGNINECGDEKNNKIAEQSLTFEQKLSFHNITFRYPETEKDIFYNASFEITPGQSIGIVGTSGAGKTTAVDIILGLLKPDKGQVLVDNVDIESNMSAWLSHVAYIPQSIFLLDDTIRANVAFGHYNSEVLDENVWKTLREAQMEEFVLGLPNGLNTTVGEQGIRLSGGQRQRIGIARALFSEPDILFFDEATSALDSDTEAAIMEAIEHLKGKKTLVIIAHRLSTIKNCDVIYRVENGKVKIDKEINCE